ncbi:hypothetical protein TWF718_000383 [Orbilia javanica]|uniref:Carboxylesterase type B domain-containing protein n=1 Tax=Orbilia javanica TaxID=47235 RepID=A0AAN8RGD4_9PEZI
MRPRDLGTKLFASFVLFGGVLCNIPDLKLKWGTYSPKPIPNLTDVKVYRDVRFGLPPTGARRFMAAESPDENFDTSHDRPANCIAVPLSLLKSPDCRAGSGVALGLLDTENPPDQNEDCLFLDIYVPWNLTDYKTPLPVIVWFYGGAYIAGSKLNDKTQGMLYGGVGAIRAAALHGKGAIFVVGNYRLGALGWLAGTYVEGHATPNAGLTDQRLLLEFVQKYIRQVGGDPDNVSAWGESAGGGSILHHLVARNEDGSLRDPLFKKAIVQSPAYEWRTARKGKLQEEYLNFTKKVLGGEDHSITALQNAPIEKIREVNEEMACNSHKSGLFPFGPAVDGKLIKQIPVYALGQKDQYWRDLESIIASHVATEAASFTKGLRIHTEAQFTKLAGLSFDDQVVEHIKQSGLYCKGLFPNWKGCYTEIVQDSMFMANVRAVYEAYKGKCYMLNYRWPKDTFAKHGTDLLFTFDYKEIDIGKLTGDLLESWDKLGKRIGQVAGRFHLRIEATASIFQQYFASHAACSSPSACRDPDVPEWSPTTGDGDKLQDGVMLIQIPLNKYGSRRVKAKPYEYFTVGQEPDTDTTFTKYKFWSKILGLIMDERGVGKAETTDSEERVAYRDEL